jgi:hypothetical protein
MASVTAATFWYWLTGLRYIASNGRRGRAGLPMISIPGLTWRSRDQLALRIFWAWKTKDFIIVAAVLPQFLLMAITAGEPASADPSAGRYQFVTLSVGLAISLIVAFTALRFIIRSAAIDLSIINICFILDPSENPKGLGNGHAATSISGPQEGQRRSLGYLAVQFSDAARILDTRQVYGATPHPMATLLRAVTQDIRCHLRSQHSWTATIPDDLRELLQSVFLLLAAPKDAGFYQALLKLTKAFDSEGQPVVEIDERPPSRIARVVSRGAAGLTGISAALAALATISVIVIAWALFVMHRMNIGDVIGTTLP